MFEGSYSKIQFCLFIFLLWVLSTLAQGANPYSEPEITVTPLAYEEVAAQIGSSHTDTLIVTNIGSEDANYTMTYPSWISGPAGGSVAAGGDADTLELIMTAPGYETTLADSILLTANDPVNPNIYVIVHFISYAPGNYFSVQYDTLSCDQYGSNVSVVTSNVGNISGFNLHGQTTPQGDSVRFLADGSVFVGLVTEWGDTLVGRYLFEDHYLHAFSDLGVDEWDEPDAHVIYASKYLHVWFPDVEGVTWPGPWFSGIDIEVEFYLVNKEGAIWFVLDHLFIHPSPRPPWWPAENEIETVGYVYGGLLLDWSLPAHPDSGESANDWGYDASRKLLYQTGWPNDGIWDQYVAGVAYDKGHNDPYSVNIISNSAYVYPSAGYVHEQLYPIVSTPGVNCFFDSTDTIHPGLCIAENLSSVLSGKMWTDHRDTIAMLFYLSASEKGVSDLQAKIDAGRDFNIAPQIMAPLDDTMETVICWETSILVLAKDPNNDTIGFAVETNLTKYTYSWEPKSGWNKALFSWTPTWSDGFPPTLELIAHDGTKADTASVSIQVSVSGWDLPCGDVGGNCEVDFTDILYFIDYIFRDGSPPLCGFIFSCADVNSDWTVDFTDILYMIDYIFRGGDPPVGYPGPCGS